MLSKVKLVNSSSAWDAKRRYNINAVVIFDGTEYQNTTGKNSSPDLGIDWINTSLIETTTTEINNEATIDAITYISPRMLWYWFITKILGRNNTWSGNNIFNKNVVIKGESSLSGNALQLLNLNNEIVAEFFNKLGVKFYGKSFADKIIIAYSNFYANETFYTMADGSFRFVTDPQSNTVWFGSGNVSGISFLEYRRNQMFFKLHLPNPDTNANNLGVLEINNYRGSIFAGSNNVRLRVNSNGATSGDDVLIATSTKRIGINNLNPLGLIDVVSSNNNEVSLPFPRMTQSQRLAIVSPPLSGFVYQTDGTEGLYVYKQTVGWTFVV